MPNQSRPSAPRYRRRILGTGLVVAGALFSIGAPFYVRGIESDLEQRVPEQLEEQGFGSVVAEFSGQDGTITCALPFSDPEAATDAAYDVNGVRSITLDRSCRINRAPSTEDSDVDASSSSGSGSTTTASTADASFGTIADVINADPRLAYLAVLVNESGLIEQFADPDAEPVTLFAPTDDAFDDLPADLNAQLRSDPELLAEVLGRHVAKGELSAAELAAGELTMIDGTVLPVTVAGGQVSVDGWPLIDTDVTTGNGVVHVVDRVFIPESLDTGEAAMAGVSVTLDSGQLTFDGVVVSEVERARLLAAAGDTPTVDQMTVDPDTGLDAEAESDLITLVTAMPANLASGVAAATVDGLSLTGVAVDAASSEAIASVATSVGVMPELTVQEAPEPSAAEALETELNAFVAENPVRFEPGSAILATESAAVLDSIAEQLLAAGAVSVVVEGHTDSDGDPDENRTLSQRRADAVRTELIARGVADAAITAEGLGNDEPVLGADGTEDKEASRRVEFRVVAS